jgi:hypothetical protein
MSQCRLHINNKHQKLIQEAQQDLTEILSDIEKMRQNARTPEGFAKSVKKYLNEMHEDKIKAEADDLMHTMKTASNYRRVMAMREKGVPVSEALRSFLTPSTYNVENAGLSIASVKNKQTIKYTNMIEQNTSRAEQKILAKGLMDEDIIFHMAGGTGKEMNPFAQKIADVFKKINAMTHQDKLNAGIAVNKIDNYVFNQSMLHNADKIRKMGDDPTAWIDMQMKDLDHDKSFPYMNTDAEKREYLEKVWKGILEREDESIVTNWDVLKAKDKGQLKSAAQAKYSKIRTLHYTPEGLVNQFKEFSDKPLVEVMLAEIAKSARDTSQWDIMGPRGQVAMDTIIQKVSRDILKQMRAETDPKIKAKLEAELDSIKSTKSTLLKEMAQLDNTNNRVKNRGVKNAFEAGRTFVNTLILGNVPLSAVTDLAWNVIAQEIQTGKGFMKSTGNMISTILKNVPADRRKAVITKMRIAQESALGHMLRVEGADTFTSRMSAKLNQFYSTILPVQWQTRLHKTWAGSVIGTDVGEMVGKNWDQLSELEMSAFKKAGISEIDWPAMRAMKEELGGEYKDVFMVTGEGVANISDELATELIAKHKAADPRFAPKKPAEYRAYLEKRYDAYTEDFMTTAVPMPGERARAFLHGTGEAGELGHETRKTLTMLKSYMVHQWALTQKVYRASPHKATKARHLSGMAVGLIAMAYGRDVLESALSGEDMPDPTEFNTVKKAVLRSGVGNVLGDVMLQNSYGGKDTSVTDLVAGPLVAKLSEGAGLAKKAVTGDFTDKDAKKLTRFIPGNNLFYLKLLNHSVVEDAAAAFSEK